MDGGRLRGWIRLARRLTVVVGQRKMVIWVRVILRPFIVGVQCRKFSLIWIVPTVLILWQNLLKLVRFLLLLLNLVPT